MLPHERSLVERLQGRPFAIVGVNSDRDRERLAALNAEAGVTWPSFFDDGGTFGPIAAKWGVRSWPTTYVLDAQGVIRFKNVRDAGLDHAVESLLAALEAR